jgi:hypothetical protein
VTLRGFGGALSAAALAALAACETAPPGAITQCQETAVVPTATDILFVVDDSGSMASEQAELGASFKSFIDRLASSPASGAFQIGVTTTSVDYPISDASGAVTVRTAYDAGPAVGVPYAAGALVAIDPATPGKILYDAAAQKFTGTRILAPALGAATLQSTFVANARVGTNGSAKEQGLRAVQLALTDRIADGTNAGFLRPGARLAVVIVTDEDDCSDPGSPPAVVFPSGNEACHDASAIGRLPPVSQYVAALEGPLGGERRDVVVALIAGVDPRTGQPVTPACNPTLGQAARRYLSLVGAFGAEALADNVCLPDFSATLERVANLIGQQVTLAEPVDPRLLTVSVSRAAGAATTACTVAEKGSAGEAAADAVYAAPTAGRPPVVSLQNRCALERGDEVQVKILCAG